MREVSMNELRTVEGGATATCGFCGKVFKDKSIFGIVYNSAARQLFYHSCAKKKSTIYGW